MAIFDRLIFDPEIFDTGVSTLPRLAVASVAVPDRNSASITVPVPTAAVVVPARPTAEIA